MDNLPSYLQYGEQTTSPSRSIIYRTGDPVGDTPVFYVIAGLSETRFFMAVVTQWLGAALMGAILGAGIGFSLSRLVPINSTWALLAGGCAVSVTGNRLAIAKDYISTLVNSFASEFLSGVLDTEGMSPAAAGLSSQASLVFPILLLEECYIDAPDDHGFAMFE